MFLANFVKIDMVKLKKDRKLGVLTSGIKRDGYQKKTRELEVPGIRRYDCISIFKALKWNKHLQILQDDLRN